MSQRVRDVYVEDVEFLRSCGVGYNEILTRLDVSAANLARSLYRESRPELAAPFQKVANDLRRAVCIHCGKKRGYQRKGQTGCCYECRWIVVGYRGAS